MLMEVQTLGLLDLTAIANGRSLERHIADTAQLELKRASFDQSTRNIKIRRGQ